MKKFIAKIMKTISKTAANAAVKLDDRKCGAVKTAEGHDNTKYASIAEAIKFFTRKGISVKNPPLCYTGGITVILDGDDTLNCREFPVIHTNERGLVKTYNRIIRCGSAAIQMVAAFGAVFRYQTEHIDIISELADVCHRYNIYVPGKATIEWLADLCRATGGYAMFSVLLMEIQERRIIPSNRCYFCKNAIAEGAAGIYKCKLVDACTIEGNLTYEEIANFHPDVRVVNGELWSSYINGSHCGCQCEYFDIRSAALRMITNTGSRNNPTETKKKEEYVAPKMSNIDIAVKDEDHSSIYPSIKSKYYMKAPTFSSNPESGEISINHVSLDDLVGDIVDDDDEFI